jgi:hypothetical protein
MFGRPTDTVNVIGPKNHPTEALYRDGHLSLARAAAVAQQPMAVFIAHLSRLGIPVVDLTAAEPSRDVDTLDEWLASS